MHRERVSYRTIQTSDVAVCAKIKTVKIFGRVPRRVDRSWARLIHAFSRGRAFGCTSNRTAARGRAGSGLAEEAPALSASRLEQVNAARVVQPCPATLFDHEPDVERARITGEAQREPINKRCGRALERSVVPLGRHPLCRRQQAKPKQHRRRMFFSGSMGERLFQPYQGCPDKPWSMRTKTRTPCRVLRAHAPTTSTIVSGGNTVIPATPRLSTRTAGRVTTR